MQQLDMKESDLTKIVSAVTDTLKFQGVYVTQCIIDQQIPGFTVVFVKKEISKSLEFLLDFTYWTLWSLVYGKYSETKFSSSKISLKYTIK